MWGGNAQTYCDIAYMQGIAILTVVESTPLETQWNGKATRSMDKCLHLEAPLGVGGHILLS